MERDFCSEGSKFGEDVTAYSIPVRIVCQESVWVYASVLQSFTSGNGRFHRREDCGSRHTRRVPRACLSATPTSLRLLHGPHAALMRCT